MSIYLLIENPNMDLIDLVEKTSLEFAEILSKNDKQLEDKKQKIKQLTNLLTNSPEARNELLLMMLESLPSSKCKRPKPPKSIVDHVDTCSYVKSWLLTNFNITGKSINRIKSSDLLEMYNSTVKDDKKLSLFTIKNVMKHIGYESQLFYGIPFFTGLIRK